ncbi:conserved hypothetical protein, mobile region [Carnobacterium divergens]|nr:conserved hypothetical protein, mobile region [Carnobacterium divergens]
MSHLTMELTKFGFFCGIENQLYTLDTGKYTTLVIEGFKRPQSIYYQYDFYKQTFYPHYPNKITVYGERLLPIYLLKRVQRYFANRTSFLEERGNQNL